MSDTSDCTIVSATSSEALVPESMSTPSGHKIMGHADDEIREVVSLIRDSCTVVYETHTRSYRDEKNARKYGWSGVAELLDMLEDLGWLIGYFPERGYAETVNLIIDIVTEMSSMLAAGGENDSREEFVALADVLIYKCTAKAQLRATELGYDRQAELLRGSMCEDIMRSTKRIHWLKNRDEVRIVAEAFHALVPKYLRSVSAIYGSSASASTMYTNYGITVLKKLHEGVEDEVSEEAEGTESTESTSQASESAKKLEKEAEHERKYTTTWYNRKSGWQMSSVEDEDNGTGSTKNVDKNDNKRNTTSGQIHAWCSSIWP